MIGRRLACLAVAAAVAWAASRAGSVRAETNGPAAVRFESARQTQSLSLPATVRNGVRLVPLRPALEYLGGTAEWHALTRKVKIRGTSGREAMLTLGLPRVVVEQQRFVRLPHVPSLVKGQVMVSLESLATLWNQIGSFQPEIDAEAGVFRVGGEPSAGSEPQAATAAPPPPPAGNRTFTVVLDAGHGGRDPGAIGPSKLHEKVVTLEICRQLKPMLEKLGARVVMTRHDDRYIPLEDRARLANRAKADLFVSVHANASRDRKASGSQVFIYNREASSRKAAETARLENLDANYLEIIKDDLRQSVHEETSITAAGLVSRQLGKLGLEVRRIERAPFYVLAKSEMPSILVETAFISHPAEEKKLRSRAFCRQLAEGIFDGIQMFRGERTARR